MTASHRGLLFRQARHAIDTAATPAHPDRVRDAAAQLLAVWWQQAAGLGLSRPALAAAGDLPGIALHAIAAVDAGRQTTDTPDGRTTA